MQNLRVTISRNGMRATLEGRVDGPLDAETAEKIVRGRLQNAGITSGIIDKVVCDAALQIAGGEPVAPVVVARGEEAQPEIAEGVYLQVPSYAQADFPYGFGGFGSSTLSYYELLEYVAEPHIVQPGETVGSYEEGLNAHSGTTVKGEVITASSLRKPSPRVKELGDGLSRERQGSGITAAAAGIVIRAPESCYLLKVSLDGSFHLAVSQDKMRISADIWPAGPEGAQVEPDRLLDRLRDMQVTGKIHEPDIREAINRVRAHGLPVKGVCVASGIPCRNGRDGYIENLVNLDFSLRPAIREDGRADYHSVHVFENVREGQKLARLHPPTSGTDGTDVFGQKVSAADGVPVTLEAGEGVAVLPDDDSVYVSTREGHVHRRGPALCVDQVLRIDSDVDYHTGDIDFTGDIVVSGDIRSGFCVQAGGSICVRGVIEDAVVKSQENIVVFGGFVGQGKGRMEARLDVVLAYVRNQTVIARRNIMISGESIDANLCAGSRILMESKKTGIIGGRAVARDLIAVNNLGGASEQSTSVCAGIDFVANVHLARTRREIADLESTAQALAAELNRIRRTRTGTAAQREARVRRRAAIESQCDEGFKRIEMLKREQAELRKRQHTLDAQVRVLGTVFPNVMIEIASYTHVIHAPARQCFFFVKAGEIRRQSLTADS
ncbi:MAG: DUF342 domain-containing protein [Chitinivibrionales bacterium]|nr:DUF342 domain-containing protein [Chitinivibrionales bacterium]MBD3394090.1 DUF342 domain-containing protein [Chitinivibrionales bacterium]